MKDKDISRKSNPSPFRDAATGCSGRITRLYLMSYSLCQWRKKTPCELLPWTCFFWCDNRFHVSWVKVDPVWYVSHYCYQPSVAIFILRCWRQIDIHLITVLTTLTVTSQYHKSAIHCLGKPQIARWRQTAKRRLPFPRESPNDVGEGSLIYIA